MIGPGQVQRLRAGSGVVHSEVADGAEETRFLQAWVRPDEPGLEPDYLNEDVEIGDDWTCGRGDGRGATHRRAQVRRSTSPTSRRENGSCCRTRPGCTSSSRPVRRCSASASSTDGDAARLADEGGRSVTAETDSHLVVWSFGAP